jgi:glycosyltransferase involved in cell wall biosynthesis
MDVLYDISFMGLAYIDARARSGIYRYTENLVSEVQKNQNLYLHYISAASFDYSLATRYSFENSMPYLIEDLIEVWRYPDILFDLYISVLKDIQSNTSSNLINKGRRKSQKFFLNLLKTIFARQTQSTLNFDIYHSCFHALLPMNLVKAKARFLTIHDLIPLLFPNYFRFSDVNFYKAAIKSVDVNKDWLVCVSRSTQHDLENSLPIANDRTFVVPLAASSKFYRELSLDKINAACNRYNIPPSKYILSLSTLEPRKNIPHLIRCFFRLLNESSWKDLNLVLVGSPGWLFDSIYKAAGHDSNLIGKVIFTGYISDDEISCIYSGAEMFVYPSLYEGFGLPPLEAMQCGTPVITSNTSSLPEVVGDAGIMIDPTDEDALCQAMLDLLNDQELRASLSQKGLARASQFSWSKCAADTVAIYKQVLSYC